MKWLKAFFTLAKGYIYKSLADSRIEDRLANDIINSSYDIILKRKRKKVISKITGM
jgi:hypothetical protein